jgi:micrococcal nuclease
MKQPPPAFSIAALIAFITFIVTAALLHAEPQPEITGTVVSVHDGDSITVLAAGNVQLKVRLDGIDAPELKQSFSQQSKQALSDLVFGKTVNLLVTGKDRYRRTLAVVMARGLNVNREMVIQGLAWRYEKYCPASCSNRSQSGKARFVGGCRARTAVGMEIEKSKVTKKDANKQNE